jgi:hypothetical protein
MRIDPEQDVYLAAFTTTGRLEILHYRQNAVPGKPIIHGAIPGRRVAIGATVAFVPTVTGVPPFSFQWRRDGMGLPGATGASLVLTNVTVCNSGSYSVIVSNAVGYSISAPSMLTVVDVPPFHFEPLGISGGNVTFRFEGEPNRLYRLEISTNLVDWSALFDFSSSRLPIPDLTFSIGGQPQKFFRAMTFP